MPPDYTIRPARQADLGALLEMYLALQDHVEGSNPDLWRMTATARRQVRAQLRARLDAPNGCVLVAEDGESGLVGMIFGRIVSNNQYTPSRTGSVDQVFVRPDHRRRRIATRLVAVLCDWFEGLGVGDVSLRYAHGNQQASAFWAACGFTPRIVIVGADLGRISTPGLSRRHG